MYAEVGDFLLMICSCDHMPTERQSHDQSPYVNQALISPEYVYGVSLLLFPLIAATNTNPHR
jgi:hypothetical protein